MAGNQQETEEVRKMAQYVKQLGSKRQAPSARLPEDRTINRLMGF